MREPKIHELLDHSRPDHRDPSRPRPVRAYVWTPVEQAGVVLLSHGTGGAVSQLAWLAEPLAEAGFLAIAVEHHGNNFVDGYLAQGFAYEWDRPRDLTFVLDALAPPGPVGVAGYSSGGYTAAALVGARIDRDILGALMTGHVTMPELPEFPDLIEKLRATVTPAELAAALADSGADYADPRVRAAFLICPAIGELIDPASLAEVDRPVEIRWGDADVITPPAGNALRYLDGIPGAAGHSAGPDVQHHHFLGSIPAGADLRLRTAEEAVAFFRTQLI